MDPIDHLVRRWQQDPSPAATIALCDALCGTSRTALVQEVGDYAAHRHAGDASVLLAVARMYVHAQRLSEAQTLLVTAGKLSPRDGDIYRWLGEVLLRRGDADRAEKVLERAIQLGSRDPEAAIWLERARVFLPMHARLGARGVAAEVARTVPLRAAPPLTADGGDDGLTVPRVMPSRPPPLPRPPPIAPFTGANAFERAGDVSLAEPQYPKDAETARAFAPSPPPPAAYPAPNDPFTTHPATSYGANAGGGPIAASHDVNGQSIAPDLRDVLDALEHAGVYEPAPFGAPPVRWDKPERRFLRVKSGILLSVVTCLVVGAGIGGFMYVRDRRAKAHDQAEVALTKVDATLRASRADALPGVEQDLKHVFELESRSPRGALAWLRERALVGLLKGGADIAFEDAMRRAKEVGVSDADTAFARVASFLFQGDTAGAVALLPKYDAIAAQDPWYQLVTGAALERAGDPRAGERFDAAVRLDPELVAAQVARARSAAMGRDPQKATELAQQVRATHADRVEGAALVALAWARDPARPEKEPAEVDETIRRTGELPLTLAFVPHALGALRALEKHDVDAAKKDVQKGLAAADGPGVAAWLGSVALGTGDEQLARKGALAALSFSAAYPPARVLAARVALLGDRLDEALKATEDLEAGSPDVALVRAAIAYERADVTMLGGALDAIPAEGRKLPFVAPLAAAPQVLVGRGPEDKLVAMADGDAPWADLLAADAALDAGDLASADRVIGAWHVDPAASPSPLRALRAARLARYQGKLDAADTLSLIALERGTVTLRVLAERAFVLVAHGKGGEVSPLLGRYPLVLGPLAAWLGAYAAASAGHVEDAKAKMAPLDPPPALSPLPARVIAAAALGAAKDRRRGVDYIKAVLAGGGQDPDVAAAATSLGFRKVERSGKRPTFVAP